MFRCVNIRKCPKKKAVYNIIKFTTICLFLIIFGIIRNRNIKKGAKITLKKAPVLRVISPSVVSNTSKIPISDSKSIKAKIDNKYINGIMNIGIRPTINSDQNNLRLEVHL